MLKRRSLWIVLAATILIALIGGRVMAKKNAPDVTNLAVAAAPAALEFLPSDVTEVKAGDIRKVLQLSGSLRAVNQAAVKAKVGGEVREVLVREGELVKQGQVLIKMDVSEYQARFEQSKGTLQAMHGQLDIATKTRDNNKELLAKGFISKNSFDNADSQYAIARANLESAQGGLDVAKKSLADTVIRAPITGLVSVRSVQPGEKVSPDNRLLDLVDLRQMEMEAALPVSDIASVTLGQEVQVTIEGLPNALPGKVARINPATQAGSRSILVYIALDNPQNTLRMGMFGEAKLTLAKKAGVLTVPQSAVQTEAGAAVIYAIEHGKLIAKPVTLGIKGENQEGASVEVLQGLDNGAQIVKTNLGNLQAGTVIRFAKAGNVISKAQ